MRRFKEVVLGAILSVLVGLPCLAATPGQPFTEKDVQDCKASAPDKRPWQIQTRTAAAEQFTPYSTCKTVAELKPYLRQLCDVRGPGNVQYREHGEAAWKDGCSAPSP